MFCSFITSFRLPNFDLLILGFCKLTATYWVPYLLLCTTIRHYLYYSLFGLASSRRSVTLSGRSSKNSARKKINSGARGSFQLVLKYGTPECRNAGMPERRNTKTRNTKLLKPVTHEKYVIYRMKICHLSNENIFSE